MQVMVRTRIAPSPTGYPHIGTLYQALFNYAFAHRFDGKFLVRIEDTDRNRFVEGAEDVIFQVLDWSGLVEDESPRKDGESAPYRQSERLNIYHEYVQKLLDEDKAYYAYYPKAEAGVKKEYTKSQITTQPENVPTGIPPAPRSIDEMIKSGDWIIRMRVPKDRTITFRDEIRGDITFETKQVTDQVLLKSDGFPTYHLAVVVDDHLMGITHVVRAEEWISSTPKHVLLYEYFGWELPKFYHTPDLRNPDKSKLSKRHGHTNVTWYRDEGYLPEAILNFLALQGWTHPQEKELFPLQEFIEVFDLKDIRPVGPIFDLTKLTWMNQQYIQNLSDEDLKQKIITFFPKSKELDDKLFDQLIPLLKTRMQTLKDFETLTKIFFAESKPELNDKEKEIAQALKKALEPVTDWQETVIFPIMKETLTHYHERMPILYHILTGQDRGLPLPKVVELLGKEKTLALLN
jgi:glutamyl-tRNA synthetase